MIAGRYSVHRARLERMVDDVRARLSLRAAAARGGRLLTRLRAVLRRVQIPRRPRGSVPRPADDFGGSDGVLRLRDEECLSRAATCWTSKVTEPTRLTRYRSAVPAGRPPRRHHRLSAGADERLLRRNEAIKHLDEIRAAYWAGQGLDDLSEQWGVSPKTIAIWVYRD